MAVYQAEKHPHWRYYDTVRGALANGSSNAVVITISPPTPPDPVTPLSLAVAASPTSVSAGQSSIVTATLWDKRPSVTVTFTLPVNNSGATLSASSAGHGRSGNAQVSNSPTIEICSDTVRRPSQRVKLGDHEDRDSAVGLRSNYQCEPRDIGSYWKQC